MGIKWENLQKRNASIDKSRRNFLFGNFKSFRKLSNFFYKSIAPKTFVPEICVVSFILHKNSLERHKKTRKSWKFLLNSLKSPKNSQNVALLVLLKTIYGLALVSNLYGFIYFFTFCCVVIKYLVHQMISENMIFSSLRL